MKRFLYGVLALIGLIGVAWLIVFDEHAYGPHPDHRMDVHAVPGTSDAPVILMLHGGSWSSGSKRWPDVWFSKAAHWLPKGYVFVSATTRLLPEADQLEQARDFASALAYVQAHAHEWGGDGSRVVLMGHSSGGHIASLVATRQDLLREAGAQAPLGAVLLDTSVIDIELSMRQGPAGFLSRYLGADRAFWREVSPAAHMDGGDPPLLFACSTNWAWSCGAARVFADAFAQVTVLPVEENHRGVNATLGRAGAYTDAVDRWLAARGLP